VNAAASDEFKALSPEDQAKRFRVLAIRAFESFGIPGDSPLTLISQRENAVFRVDHAGTAEPYALRVHRFGYQSKASIRSELQWMNALREGGIHTPEPMKGVDGDTVQTVSVPEVPEPRHCDVFSWVEGAALGTDDPIDAYRLLGQTNARIHRQAKEWTLPRDFTRQRWDEAGMLGEAPLWGRYADLEALDANQLERMHRAKAMVLERLAHYGKGRDRFGLIHADLMHENILLHEGRPTVIDFDDSGFGWFMYDPATLLAFDTQNEDFEARLDGWVEGYRSVEPLASEHLAELPTLIMCRILVGLGWLHTRRETPLARGFTDAIVQLASAYAERFLASRS
jgi:Ser/Thr protein kinase RdoA (MazF antagonist)